MTTRGPAVPDQTFRFRGHHRPDPGVRASILQPLQVKDADRTVVELRLYDPIDSWGGEWGVSAKEFADSLAALPDDTSEIRLHVNSPGGEVWEGIAILNQLRNHRARVVAVVDGLAASAASVIACGADETIMGRNSQLMIHDAWGLCIGNRDDMQSTATRLDKISDNIASVYAAKAGGDVPAWRSAMLSETWYSAEEAVEQGLADTVEAAPEPKDQAAFDLSMFEHAGRENAPDPTFVAVTPAAPAEPDPPQQPETDAPPGPSDLDQRRHRLNARKADGRAPVPART
jgi:ATP-dependent Clp endopeptidase proteolytic subunit ClpP